MKRNNIFSICWFLLLLNITRCAPSEQIERNIENVKKLKVGMALNEALKIMGEPHEVRTYPNKYPKYKSATTVYFYESPVGASEWISFEIDSTKTIVEVTTLETKE